MASCRSCRPAGESPRPTSPPPPSDAASDLYGSTPLATSADSMSSQVSSGSVAPNIEEPSDVVITGSASSARQAASTARFSPGSEPVMQIAASDPGFDEQIRDRGREVRVSGERLGGLGSPVGRDQAELRPDDPVSLG